MDNNLLKAFSSLADATRENSYSTTDSKLENLALKREEKLNSLGTNSQYTDLDDSYTKLEDTGTLESNKNKIWNEENAAGIQTALSDAVNQQIYTRDDGSKYQLDAMGNERDYAGETRRAYMYGTKTDPDAVKFGLARGDLPSADYRYQPGRAEAEGYSVGQRGYGWDSGDEGVDLNKKYLDVELPYETATALEGLVHGRADAIANRQYPNYLSDKALQQKSGVSEYYTSLDGLLGDSTYEEVPAESRLAEAAKLEGAQPQEYVDRNAALASTFESEPDYNQLRNFAAGTLNVIAKIRGTIGEGMQTFGEADEAYLAKEQERLDKYYPGEKVSDWRKNVSEYFKDTGSALTKEMREFQLNKRADKITGYDSKNADALTAEVQDTIKNDGYIAAIGKALTDERSLEVLVRSLPEMVALGVSVGGMAVVNAQNNIDLGQAEIGREFTTREKVLSTATSIVGTYLDRAGDKLALGGMNEAKGVLKKAVDAAPDSVKDALRIKFGDEILAIGQAPLRLAGAGAAEGTTEYGQTLAETAAQRPDVFKEGFTSAEMEEAGVAGVLGAAMGGQIASVPVARDLVAGPTKEELEAKQQEILAKTEAEVKDNLGSKLAEKVEVEDTEEDVEINSELGLASVKQVYDKAEDAESMLAEVNKIKSSILNDVYEYDAETNQITGVKDVAKLKAVDAWFDQYGKYQADENGNIPKYVQEEINYIKQANIDYGVVPENVVETKAANRVVKDVGDVTNVSEADIKANVETKVDELIKEYGLEESLPNIEEFRANVKKKALENYGISGMVGLSNKIQVELDKEAFAEQARMNAGVKTKLDSRGMKQGGTVVDIGSVTNEELQAVLSGEGVSYATDHPNTKFRERAVRKLDPLSEKSVVDTLVAANTQMDVAIAKNQKEAGKYLKGGDVTGNMKRLMAIAINTINGQVASDTELRANTADGDSMLKSNEYWAGRSSTMEQIGKDYATSYGLKLTGDAKDLAKVYRNLGRFALKMLEDADLVETTNDYIWSRAGDTIGKDNKQIGPANVDGVSLKKASDALTNEDVVLVKDKGIRLKDTVSRENELAEGFGVNRYESKLGDAFKRVAMLMLPNAERVPSTEYVKTKIKVADKTEIDKEVEAVLQDAMSKPIKMKRSGHQLEVLRHLKGLNESTPGGLQAAIAKNPQIKEFLMLVDSGSELLAVSDSGSIQGKLDNLIGILDNLDELSNEEGVYYTFQVDINGRLTLVETVGNYQGDKVYARPLMGAGEYTIQANDEGAKEVLVKSLVDELAGPEDKGMSDMEVLTKYTRVYEKIETLADGNVQELMERMATSPVLAHAVKKKGGIRLLSALEGARDVVNSGGGKIKTEYIPEKDASASGVFNTTINLAGRDVKHFKERLMELGVSFGDEVKADTTDAYTILKNIIYKMIAKVETEDVDAGRPANAVNIDAVKKLKDTLRDEKFMRNLAKYPIMTWFYSAEKKSIVDNLVLEATSELVSKAISGDKNVLMYLSDVVGKEVTADSVKKIKKGSKEHRAIRAELGKVGEAFYTNLNEAFPEVEKNKQEMVGYFKYLEQNAKVDKKDYWDGRIRTAISVINGTNKTTSLYKWKNRAISMSAAEKIEAGLATEDESESLITEMDRVANQTSMMAFFAHLVDSAQAVTWLKANKDGEATMSIHDGFRGRPQDLLKAQKMVEEMTVKIAAEYDFVNEMAVSMRDTAKRMREDIDNVDAKTAKELEDAASKFEAKAAEIEKVNNPRWEAKKELLKNAKTTLFGKDGYTETETEVEVKEPEVVVAETKEKVYTDILDVVADMDTADERKGMVLANKEGIKMVTLDEAKTKELLASKAYGKTFKDYVKSGTSFTHNGTVYIGRKTLAGESEVEVGKATNEEVLDVLVHEIEHAVIDTYVDKNAESKEVQAIQRVLDRVDRKKIGKVAPRVRQRINYVLNERDKGKKLQAVKELVAVSQEDTVAADVLNELNRMAGLEGTALSRVVKALWAKIKEVMESTPLSVLLDKTDVYTLGVAIEAIRSKARGLEVNEAIAKEDDGTITRNTEKNPFDEDFSGYTSKIEPIC